MNKPLVTIITPAYNCAKYLPETIDSVLDNGYENIEYLVIDDKSTDNTLDILAGIEYGLRNFGPTWIGADDRLLVVGWKDNHGEQFTVNAGFDYIQKMDSKYFMIVNADDPLLPGAISKLIEFMEAHPDIICAYPDWESINEDGSHRAYITSREYDFSYMINHHTCLPSVGSMFRSSLLKTIRRDESYRWLGDFDFWLKVGFLGPMAHVPQTLATWRNRNGQASGDKSDKRAQEHIRIASDFGGEARCWSYLVAAVVTDSKTKALLYIVAALSHRPLIILSIEFWDIVRRRALNYLRR